MNFWDIYFPVLAALITLEVLNGVLTFVLMRRRMKKAEEMMAEEQAQMAERLAAGELGPEGSNPFANMGMVFLPGLEHMAPPFPTHSGSEKPEEKENPNVGQYV